VSLPVPDGYLPEYAGSAPAERERLDQHASQGVRAFLQDLRAALVLLHEGGASGRTVNEAHSDAIDRLLRKLVQLAEARWYADRGELEMPPTLIAVGGYARREMSIGSDVDILFLHRGELTPMAAEMAQRIQYWLWDAGVILGGAIRSVAESIDLGRRDATVATSLLTARFLAGEPELLHQLVEAVRRELLVDVAAFVDGQRASLAERHQKYGESLYLLQPNLKEGAGGLRDYHTALWVACAVFPPVRSLEDLLHVGLLSENEMATFRAALDFLWRIRNELHIQLGRKNDQMDFDHQERMAARLGYPDDGTVLPVERFMGEYYRHARAIRSASEIVLEQCAARSRPPAPPQPAQLTEDGFRVTGGRLEIPHAAHLRERPIRLLSAFRAAQQHRVTLSRTARRLVANNLDVCDESLQRDPDAARVFLAILNSEHRVTRTLTEMNEVGLLARYLPEWDHIFCRWQHVMYHTYTVDVHSIFLVEELRRLWQGKYEAAHPELTEMMRGVADRPALFLGCLLHDIGKGRGGDHSDRGAALARRCVERLGLPPPQSARVVFLVQQHLLMSKVAQRRDLSDPKVIVEFARAVGDREALHDLYLLTFADIRASSKSGWTGWKGQLLKELYERTAEFLETGEDDPQRALEQIEERVEARRRGARTELRSLGVGGEKIEAYFADMPRRYFTAHTPRQIARHALAVLGFDPIKGINTAVREMRGGFSEFLLVARDVHGLYAQVAGSLAAAGINILGSNVYTTKQGLALEVYRVSTPPGGSEERQTTWDGLHRILRDVLGGSQRIEDLLRGRRARLGSRRLASREPPSVEVGNEESDFYTVIDVTADDRLGLLHDLVRTIADHGLEIYVSKATTILDQVADTFYVKDANRRKLTDPERLERLRRDLQAAAEGVRRDG
jgi:[protein-PII] uridylyltransferase